MSKRRSPGEGSVYQRKDGLWVGQYVAQGKKRMIARVHINLTLGRIKLRTVNALQAQTLY